MNNKQEEIYTFITNFQEEFNAKFGIYPQVQYFLDDQVKKSRLYQLEISANTVLNCLPIFIKCPDGIKTKKRYRELVTLRHCVFFIALEYGFGSSDIGSFFNFNHATILHSQKIVPELIEIKDKLTINILKQLKDDLQKRNRIDANVQFDEPTKINT